MTILFALLSYLFGSIPTGYLIYRFSERKDIRNFGSQSIGATNVLRLKGWKYALLVGFLDVLKGFLPVFLALKLFPDKTFALLCGFLSVLGHCFPVFIKFKGGKGVATSAGVYASLALKPFLIMLILFLIVVAITRYVSLGSLFATFAFPLFVFLLKGEIELIYLGGVIFLLIIFRHKSNILRLLQRKERKLGERIS